MDPIDTEGRCYFVLVFLVVVIHEDRGQIRKAFLATCNSLFPLLTFASKQRYVYRHISYGLLSIRVKSDDCGNFFTNLSLIGTLQVLVANTLSRNRHYEGGTKFFLYGKTCGIVVTGTCVD